jgi:hypothetical protein
MSTSEPVPGTPSAAARRATWPEPHTEVTVPAIPDCDFKHDPAVPAGYDGKTVMGPWANMCEDHFQRFGTGLGLGHGQKLVLKPFRPVKDLS